MNNILIVGNGHSYAEIDYRRLPSEYKIMRFNDFYKEDKYYIGKRVDYCLCYSKQLEQIYYRWRTLNNMKVDGYEIDIINGIYATVLFEQNKHFPSVKMATHLIQQNIAIAEFRSFYEYYHEQYLPTGIQGIALAEVLGFDNIYIAGFDFGLNTISLHKWDDSESSSDELMRFHNRHPLEMQIEFINLLKTQYKNTKLLSVCEKSPINKYINKGPIIYENINYVIQPKINHLIEISIPDIINNKDRDFT